MSPWELSLWCCKAWWPSSRIPVTPTGYGLMEYSLLKASWSGLEIIVPFVKLLISNVGYTSRYIFFWLSECALYKSNYSRGAELHQTSPSSPQSTVYRAGRGSCPVLPVPVETCGSTLPDVPSPAQCYERREDA